MTTTDEEHTYSGQFRVRLPVGLHAALVTKAERQGVSLNTLVVGLLAGGIGTQGPGLRTAQLYDPIQGTWTATGRMRYGRYSHTTTLLPNGTVLVAGGLSIGSNWMDTCEVYTP